MEIYGSKQVNTFLIVSKFIARSFPLFQCNRRAKPRIKHESKKKNTHRKITSTFVHLNVRYHFNLWLLFLFVCSQVSFFFIFFSFSFKFIQSQSFWNGFTFNGKVNFKVSRMYLLQVSWIDHFYHGTYCKTSLDQQSQNEPYRDQLKGFFFHLL